MASAPPHSWLNFASQFGHVEDPDWKNATAENAHDLAAARDHHRLARRVRDAKRRHGLTDADLAREMNVSVETVGRYLRGDTTIPLAAMHHLAAAAGLDIRIEINPRR